MSDIETTESIGHEMLEEPELEAVAPGGEIVHLSADDMAVLEAGRAEMANSASWRIANSRERRTPDRRAAEAIMLSESDQAPRDLRGKPFNAYMLLKMAEDLGLPDTAAIDGIDIIEGKPTVSPETMNALILGLGRGHIRPHPQNDDSYETAIAIPYGPDGERFYYDDPDTGTKIAEKCTFTWRDAQLMGLVLEECEPLNHSEACKRLTKERKNGRKCKSNWAKMPKNMLWARALAKAAHLYFPDVAKRVYSAEELGADDVDSAGRPVDFAYLELPEGIENPYDVPPPEPIDPDHLFLLTVTLKDLAARADAEQSFDDGRACADVLALVIERWKERIGFKPENCDRDTGERYWRMVKGMVPDWEGRVSGFVEWTAAVDSTSLPAREQSETVPVAPEAAEVVSEPESEPEGEPAGGRVAEINERVTEAPEPIRAAIWEQVKEMQLDEVSAALAAAGLPATGKANELRMLLAGHLVVEKLDDEGSQKAIQVARELEAKKGAK